MKPGVPNTRPVRPHGLSIAGPQPLRHDLPLPVRLRERARRPPTGNTYTTAKAWGRTGGVRFTVAPVRDLPRPDLAQPWLHGMGSGGLVTTVTRTPLRTPHPAIAPASDSTTCRARTLGSPSRPGGMVRTAMTRRRRSR